MPVQLSLQNLSAKYLRKVLNSRSNHKYVSTCPMYWPSTCLYSYRNMLIRKDMHVYLLTSLNELLAVNTVEHVAFFR
jgi:hypothetical protein